MLKKFTFCSLILMLITLIGFVIFSRSGSIITVPVRSQKEQKAFENNFPLLSAAVVDTITIPGLNSAYIPQGITFDHDNANVIISYYFKGIGPKKPSVIAVVDINDSSSVKTYNLCDTDGIKYTGHAGALTLSDNHLWTCSNGRVLRFPYPPQSEDQSSLIPDKAYNVDSNADFLTIHNNTLWVGDYENGDNFTTLTHHHQNNKTAWIASYKIHPQTQTLLQSKTYNVNNRTVLKPETVILIDQKVQGMAFYKDTLALTTSFSHPDSKLNIYRISTQHKEIDLPDGTTLKSLSLNRGMLIKTLNLPAGAEDISCSNNKLAVIFESASKHYRHKWRFRSSHIEDRILILQMDKLRD